jgi:hypothetical protein
LSIKGKLDAIFIPKYEKRGLIEDELLKGPGHKLFVLFPGMVEPPNHLL